MIKITFIGTGSAKISSQRFFSSLLFEVDNERILLDCGEGTSKALLQQNIDITSIDKIIISHNHSDHLAGLAGLLTQFKLLARKTPLEIIIHKNNLKQIHNYLKSLLLFSDRLEFEIRFLEFFYEKNFQLTKNFSFRAKENSHLDKYKEYKSIHQIEFASPSFLFNYKNKKIFYSSDIGTVEDLFLFNEKFDLFICEITHIESKELMETLKELRPEKTYLIHIPDEKVDEIKEKIRLTENEGLNCRLAFDGLSILLD